MVYATSTGEDPQDNKSQRREIKSGNFRHEGGNKKIRLVTADTEGNWSKEIEIMFRDVEKQHEIRVDKGFGKGDALVQFVFPKDEQSFKTSLQSLIRESIEQKIVDNETVKKTLQEILRDNKQ